MEAHKLAIPETMPTLETAEASGKEFKELADNCFIEADQGIDIKLRDVIARVLEEQTGKERLRIVTLILKEKDRMAAEYRYAIKHTGGLLTKSMVYAYSKAINEVFKLINTTKRNKTDGKETRSDSEAKSAT